jgi:carbamoyltransferase
MRVVGISEGYHDAGYCVLDGNEITHASHSERYSRVKNDPFIHVDQILENAQIKENDTIAY